MRWRSLRAMREYYGLMVFFPFSWDKATRDSLRSVALWYWTR